MTLVGFEYVLLLLLEYVSSVFRVCFEYVFECERMIDRPCFTAHTWNAAIILVDPVLVQLPTL